MALDQIRELYFMYGVPTDDISDSQLQRALGAVPDTLHKR